MLRRLLAASLLCLMASQAFAADTCTLREYNTIGQAQNQPVQIALEPGIADQVTPDFTSAATQSSAFNAATSYVVMICNVQTSYLVGTNPTAAATNLWIPAATLWGFGVPVGQGYKLSVHTNP